MTVKAHGALVYLSLLFKKKRCLLKLQKLFRENETLLMADFVISTYRTAEVAYVEFIQHICYVSNAYKDKD